MTTGKAYYIVTNFSFSVKSKVFFADKLQYFCENLALGGVHK